MIFWIITVIITFFLLRWIVKVPCLIEKRVSTGPNSYDYKNIYTPIGMKLWTFLLIVVVSFIPILNLLIDLAAIVAFFIYKADESIDWDEMFPGEPGKIMSFLNKKL